MADSRKPLVLLFVFGGSFFVCFFFKLNDYRGVLGRMDGLKGM